MNGIKYCVVAVSVNCMGEADVSYYAYQEGAYGLHKTGNIYDVNVI